MVRIGPFLVLLTLAAAPVAGQSAVSTEVWRIRDATIPNPDRQLPAISVGSAGSFGLGMYGFKSQAPRGGAVIGQELSTPKQRRAGVGFSLKF